MHYVRRFHAKRFAALLVVLPLLFGTQSACAEGVESVPAPVVAQVETPAAAKPVAKPAVKAPVKQSPVKSAVQYEAGVHYQVLDNPARTQDPNKIEVMEVFWYGCSHCYAFEPLIHSWKEGMADDVVFARTPAIWRDMMKTHAKVYYTAEALDMPDALHNDIFALLEKNQRLEDHKVFAQIFAKYGVSEEKYMKTVNAFGITGKVSQAESRARKNYKVQGTPELIVNGKYRISGKSAGGQAGMLEVVNYLVDLERKNK